MTTEIPQTWEELQKQGQTAIFVLETVMRVPVPRTIKDAVDGKWMEASAGATRDILGRTTRAEKKEWRKRVIKLSDANQILRDLENKIVNSYVLASASPLRIALDGIILIPKWIVKHIAELTLIMLPLFLTSVEKAGDLFMIEERILEIERRIAYLEKEIAELYTVTPRPPRRAGLPELPPPQRLSDYLPPTADELRAAIKGLEEDIAVLNREKTALAGLSVKAGNMIDLAVTAFCVTIAFLAVANLIGLARSLSDNLATTGPASKLRDEAIELAKSKSLPQFSVKRKTVKKRSRRN